MSSRRTFVMRTFGAAAALMTSAPVDAADPPSLARPRDQGLWVTWYDLPDAGRDEHLAWVHSAYIPALLKRPGIVSAVHYAAVVAERAPTTRDQSLGRTTDPAVPTGNAYFLIVGAEHSHVFGAPVPSDLHKELSGADRAMLAMRIGERTNIFAEAARVTGPEDRTYAGGMTLAPCVQIGTFNTAVEHEDEILAWYAQSRLPAMSTLPGCIRTRKLASVSGWAKQGILYEFGSVELRNKYYTTFEDPHPEMKTWSARVLKYPVHAPGSPVLGRRIWPLAAG
jgi:hypothetical protein